MTIIRELLRRPVAYHAIVGRAFGSVNLAIMWCQLLYWSERTRNAEGWIHKTMEELYKETALSRREQETARKIGIALGVLEIKKMGNPCTVNFRINFDKSEEVLKKFCDNDQNEINNRKLPLKVAKKIKEEKIEDTRPALEKMLTDKNRHVQVIGVWAKETGINMPNKEIMQSVIRRNLRAAVLLNGYANEDIVETIKVLKNTEYLKKFTLETVGKFIDEVVKNKKKGGPRIVSIEYYERDGVKYAKPIYSKV